MEGRVSELRLRSVAVDIALAISTVGRPERLEQLLSSVAEQDAQPTQVIVADQSGGDHIAQVVDRWAGRLPIRRIASTKGISVGRNDALDALEPCDVVTFPDDDVVYPPGLLSTVVKELSSRDLDGITGRLVAPDGQSRRLAFADDEQLLHPGTVWTLAISPTMFFRRSLVDAVGHFDPSIGVGATSPWQSAEESDYLLRALKADKQILFHPGITVIDNLAAGGDAPLAKVRAYARGTGYVTRRHYGPGRRIKTVVRPLAGAVQALLRGQRPAAARHLQAAIGRAEGLTGRTTRLLAPPAWNAPV